MEINEGKVYDLLNNGAELSHPSQLTSKPCSLVDEVISLKTEGDGSKLETLVQDMSKKEREFLKKSEFVMSLALEKRDLNS